jgi:hypothetical protein
MPFDTKKALESWQKAKPLLLNNTGISEVLRSLPQNPGVTQLPAYMQVGKKLETFMTDAKIKKETKALACLKTIHSDIGKFLTEVKTDRVLVLHSMETIHTTWEAAYAALAKDGAKAAVAAGFMNKTKSLTLNPKANIVAVLPHPLREGWDKAQHYPEQALEAIHRNLVAVESGKSTSDPKVLLKGYLQDLHDWAAKMKLVINAVKAL